MEGTIWKKRRAIGPLQGHCSTLRVMFRFHRVAPERDTGDLSGSRQTSACGGHCGRRLAFGGVSGFLGVPIRPPLSIAWRTIR